MSKLLSASIATLLILTAPAPTLRASVLDPPSTGGVVALDRILARLGTHRRLLVMAAHPDDEDSTLLALVARGQGGEAAYLSLSRGEGGQNLIGEELGVDLGLLRSQELLSARQVDGAQQFFTRAYDFGYTRSLDETLGFWPRQVLLEDVVRVVRRFKPQVMVSVFPPSERAGHGQHQAAGVMAQESFTAAADPAFPGLGPEGLPPWQPTALFLSAWFSRGAADLTLPTGGLDPLTGKSYHQIAMASRSMHRSQDMGMLQDLGPRQTRVNWIAGGDAAPAHDLFEGIDTRLTGLVATLPDGTQRQALAGLLDDVERRVAQVRREVSPADLERSLPTLLEVLQGLEAVRERLLASAFSRAEKLIVEGFLDEKIDLTHKALAIAAGISVDATVERETVVPGTTVTVRATLYNAGRQDLGASVALTSPQGWVPGDPVKTADIQVAPGAAQEWDLDLAVPPEAPLTVPYFLRRPMDGALYSWDSVPSQLWTRPFEPPPLVARFRLVLGEAEVWLEREVVSRHRDQARGEIRRPLRAVPRIEIRVTPELVVWPTGRTEARPLEVVLTSHASEPLSGTLEFATAPGWTGPKAAPFSIGEAEGRLALQVDLQAPEDVAPGSYDLSVAAVLEDGARYELAVPVIDYEHVRPTPAPKLAQVRIRAADIRFPALEAVGYIRGASDRVPEFLAALGVPVHLLSARQVAQGNAHELSRFDAVVVGSRAYEADSQLASANPRLLDYVRGGGLLIVQYQQYQFVRGNFAPYTLEIVRPHGRVTDENAPVTLLDPQHPVFHRPHEIVESDWSGWVQERGLYFPRSWDEAYTPLLGMSDPGGTEQRGSLLVARLGQGTYVYTGLALFRQIPAGVPGAYRLFANLLALGQE